MHNRFVRLARFLRRVAKISGPVCLGLAFIYAGFAIVTARSAVFPSWYERSAPEKQLSSCSSYMKKTYVYCANPKQSLDLDYNEFAIETGDVPGHDWGPVRTTGWAVPLAHDKVVAGTVILVHGGGADRRAMLKHVKYLHGAAYNVVLIDCHNHGMSGRDGHGISFGLWESRSIIDAALWAKKNMPGALDRPVFAMGTSQGAFAALKAMAESSVIRAVVAENPYRSVKGLLREFPALSWEPKAVKEGALWLLSGWLRVSLGDLDVRAFVDRLGTRPVLLVHGTDDGVVSLAQSQDIYGMLKEPRQLWIVPGGRHEYLWNVAGREYEQRVLAFLQKDTVDVQPKGI